MKTFIFAAAAMLLFLAGLKISVIDAQTAPTGTVVLVHGYLQKASTMQPLADKFKAAGFDVHNLQMPSQDNYRNAKYICDYINSKGLTNVILEGHSMGGLSTLYCVMNLDTQRRIKAWIGLDSPIYGGTDWMSCNPWVAGGQMCSTSQFMKDLHSTPLLSQVAYLELKLSPTNTPLGCLYDLPGTYSLSTHSALPKSQLVFDLSKQFALTRTCP